jgi:hypothetical protein
MQNSNIFEFLDWLVEQPYAHKTLLSVTTNGTTYNEKLLKYIERFNIVGVQLSIDGVENDFEYIRSGANFKQLEKVCDSFYELKQKYSNFNMGCHYTLSWMNCLKFADFYNWMHSRYPNLTDLYVSKLEQPDHYSIEILSLELRTKIYNEVISKLTVSEHQGLKNGLFLYKEHMLSTAFDTFDLVKFKYGVSIMKYILDERRGTDSTKIVKDFRECKSVIDALLNALKIASKGFGGDIPLPLLLSSKLLSGYSSDRAFLNVIANFEELGLPTGTMPDGSPNLMLASMKALLDGSDQENASNGKSQIAIFPLSITPIGQTIPIVCYGK